MSKNQILKNQKQAISLSNSDALAQMKISLGIILAVLSFLLYIQSIHHEYTLDDHPAIDQNKITTKGFADITTLLKTDYWFGYQDDLRGPVYRPTSLIVFAIVWQFSPNSPHIYHFINVLFYALTCWVLFLVLCELFKKQTLLFPFVCSLLYACHPIHTEVVNNIKSLDEILCFLFALTSILLFVKYLNKGSIVAFVLSAISFFLSLLSKETGITFLILIPLILYFFTDSSIKKLVVISLVLIGISAVYFLIRSVVLSGLAINISSSVLNNTLLAAPDFISRQATAFYILLRYLFLLIFPHPLTCDYNFSQIKIQTLADPLALIAILLFVSWLIYSLMNIKKKSVLAFGILFFLIAVAPVSNIFFLMGSTMAERFMYTPSLGFCLIVTYFLMKFTTADTKKPKFHNIGEMVKTNPILFGVLFVILGLYSIKTFSRTQDWVDNYTIFNHDAEISDNSAMAHYNKGYELMANLYSKENNPQKKAEYLDVAIIELNKAIAIYPYYSEFYFKLAKCYFDKNDNPNALANYYKGLELKPKMTQKLFRDLATIYDRTNQFEKELSVLDSAIQYGPDTATLYNDKGCTLFSLKKYNEAIIEYQKAIFKNPKLAMAYKNMGSSYINLGQYPKALESLEMSANIDSKDAETFKLMGLIYQAMGDQKLAKEYLEKANAITEGAK